MALLRSRSLTTLCLSVLVLSGLGASVRAGPADDRRLGQTVQRAEAQLRALELEEARNGLEEAARNRDSRRASRPVRARLYVTLGRARAELGDLAGAEEAFVVATKLKRDVQLPASVSPKIREVLERARARTAAERPAPPPRRKPQPRAERRAPPTPKPPPPTAKASTGSTTSKTAPSPSRTERPAEAAPPKASPPPPPPKTKEVKPTPPRAPKAEEVKPPPAPKAEEVKPPPPPAPKAEEAPPPPPPRKLEPALHVRIEPGMTHRALTTFILTPVDLPANARLFGYVAPASAGVGAAERIEAVRTGTVARLSVASHESGLVAWFEAKARRRVLATAASRSAPFVVEPPPPPPPIEQAWSEPPEEHPMPGLEATPSASPTRTSSAASAGAPLTEAAPSEPGRGLTDLEVAGIITGGALLVAGIVTLAVVLSQGDGCDAPEGYGCTEIRALPLARF